MKEYYSRRASEFEQSYHREDPVRQQELTAISHRIVKLFSGKKVLEIACGTGYWTEKVSKVADHVVGIDITSETLEIARSKGITNASFVIGNAYKLQETEGIFDAGLANFWFSHIPKDNIGVFLNSLHKRLGSGATVFMADNIYLPGIGGELKIKNDNNTYKVRELSDGTTYEIIKNYYSEQELEGIFRSNNDKLNIHIGECFWWIDYIIR